MSNAMPVDPSARNHLLVTRGLRAQGRVRHCPSRLGDFLRGREAAMLRLEDAQVTLNPSEDTTHWAGITMSMAQLVFAHEYIDAGSDQHLQASDQNARVPVAILLGELALRGRMRSQEVEAPRRFFSLTDLEVTMAEGEGRWLAESLRSIPWLLINRDQVQAILVEGD